MIRTLCIIIIISSLLLCDAREYRTHSGRGNNVANPLWGTTGSAMRRLFPAFYNGTGGDTLRQSVIDSSVALPIARRITNTLYTHTRLANTRFVSDFHSMFAGFIFPESVGSIQAYSGAAPNPVPANDTFLDPTGTGTVTLPFNRYLPVSGTGTGPDNPRQFGTRVTTFLDLSNIYGSDDNNTAATPNPLNLRTFVGGRILVDPVWDPPPSIIVPNQGAWRLSAHFQTNHLPQTVALDNIFRREHNRQAAEFAAANPTWDDNTIYEEARRMTIAIYQKISSREYLATLVGAPLQPYTGYNASADPRNLLEFNAAVFRYVHSELNTQAWRLDTDNTFLSSDGEIPFGECPWRALLHNTADGDVEAWMRGMAAQVQRRIAPHMSDALRNTNVGGARVQNLPGQDVGVLDIARGRDVGLPPYNAVRMYLGLPRCSDFDSVSSDPQIVADLRALYLHVDDIDFIVGMLAEDHLPGSSTGQVLKTMMQLQFTAWRDGDRFWYENPTYFTANETAEIYETTWQTLLYRNTNITSIQQNVFFTPTFAPTPLLPSDTATSYDRSQLLDPAFLLSWTIVDTVVNIELRVKALGWIGIGWEPNLNTMKGADIALCRIFDNGTVQVVDSYARDVGIPTPDVAFGGTDDITRISGFRQDGVTIIRFTRPLIATDRWDKPVGRLGQPSQKIMYAFHLTETEYSYHGPNRDEAYANWQQTSVTIVEDSDALAMALTIITAILTVAPAVTLALVIKHRSHARIRAATFSFCVLICLGVFLGFAAVFVMMATQDAVTCNLGFFFAGGAYVLVYQSILFKTWRIHRIFNREHNLKQQVVSTRTLGAYVGVSLLVEMALDIIWVLVDPEMIGYQASGNQLLRTCVGTNNDGFLYAWILYKLVFLVGGAYLAYRVRDVHEQYNESNSLGNSIYITMFIAILCLILGMILRAAPNVGLVVRWASLTFALSFTLGSHFVPKFIAIYGNHVSPMGTQLGSPNLQDKNLLNHPQHGSPMMTHGHIAGTAGTASGGGHALALNVHGNPGGAPRSPGIPVPRAAFGPGGGGQRNGSSPVPPSPQLAATNLSSHSNKEAMASIPSMGSNNGTSNNNGGITSGNGSGIGGGHNSTVTNSGNGHGSNGNGNGHNDSIATNTNTNANPIIHVANAE